MRDRQCVEHPGGPVAVAAQRVEERRAVPGRNAVQDGQVQLERAFADMEDAPVMMAEPPAMSSTAISVIRYRSSSGLILASDLASSWARSSGERSIRSADPPLYTNWASGAESWRDR